MRTKQTDVNALITEALAIIKYDKSAQKCNFKLILDSTLPLTQAPFDQLQQVFINILLNSLDAVLDKEGKITVSSQSLNGRICVKIKDNGKGISRSNIDKIFEPFFTTKEVGKGTGFGLWVSYGIIESIRGTISVESKENVGSTFTIEFPIMN